MRLSVCLFVTWQNCGQNTGYAPRAGPARGTIAWQTPIDSFPTLILGADGTIYEGASAYFSNNGTLR